jgi:para-nitrobenzyl esterase
MRSSPVVPSALAALVLACGLTRPRPAAPVADPATRRVLASGAVVGTAGRYGGHAWLGIPYARPPVGELRWRAPEPPAPWDGTREALRAGSPCPQLASPFGGVDGLAPGTPAGDEDCLFLNVWAPACPPDGAPAGARLPVMLWIHGGGNSVGHGGFYDGSNLATTHGLVVITVNYRLGPFGWFRHAALRVGSDATDASGNFGTLDLVRALAWVRENAAAFGGDPGNVTVFGESAGARNVLSLLVAPPARGLFHRAIAQSGGFGFHTVEEAEHFRDEAVAGHARSSAEILATLLVRDGTATDRDAAKAALAAMSAPEVARRLRTKTSAEILTAASGGHRNGLLDVPTIFRDGAVMPREEPLALLDAPGRHADVPIVLGTTRDEMKLFLFADPAHVRRWFGVLPALRDPVRYAVAAEYGSRMWKARAADELAIRLRGSQRAGVWVYRFDWDEEPTILWSDLGVMLGAAHGLEIPFVFGHFDLGPQANAIWTGANAPGRRALSAAMMSYWAEFARAGDPGRGRHGELPAWAPSDAGYAVLDTPGGGGIRMATDLVTTARVLADLEADPRLPTRRDKCEQLRDVVLFAGHVPREDYPAAGCADFPLDRWPWPE